MLDYSGLRDIQQKEMESSAIVSLPEDFYDGIRQLLEKKSDEAHSSKSLLSIKEYENIKKIVISIQMKREEKIVMMAVRGEREGAGLTSEEKEMLKGLSSIIMKSRETVKNVWGKEDSAPDRSRRIKLVKDVAQYRGLDNTTYGPFKEGDETSLPGSEVEWLLKAGLAELM